MLRRNAGEVGRSRSRHTQDLPDLYSETIGEYFRENSPIRIAVLKTSSGFYRMEWKGW